MAPPVGDPDTGLNAAVAAELRAEMARKKMSTQALATAADIPYGSLRRYLATERHIDVAVLEQLAVALGRTSVEIVRVAEERVAAEQPADELAARRGSALEAFEEEQTAARNPGRPPSGARDDD